MTEVNVLVKRELVELGPGSLPGFLRRVLVPLAVDVVVPVTHADPTELVLAAAAGHVVTAAVLLDRRVALRAILRVHVQPLQGFRVLPALFYPLAQLATADRLVVVFPAAEAKAVIAAALDQLWLGARHFDNVAAAARRWTPTKQFVRLDERVSYEPAVLCFVLWGSQEAHDGFVVDQNVTSVVDARDRFGLALLRNFRFQILRPAVRAVQMAAWQAGHFVRLHRAKTNETLVRSL